MAMASIKFYYQYNRKNKLNKEGKALLQLVAYKERSKDKTKHKYISTEIYLSPYQWDLSTSIIINHDNQARLNYKLSELKGSYEKKYIDLINRNGSCSLSDLERKQRTNYLSFIEFAENELELTSKTKKPATIAKYGYTIDKLKAYRNNIHFSDLTYSFIQGFDSYLASENLRRNVIAKYHGITRYFINEAIRKDLMDPGSNPYFKFKIISCEPTPRVYLSIEEVNKIEELEFDPSEFYLERERDAFLFSCYTANRNESNKLLSPKMFPKRGGEYFMKARSNKNSKYINFPLAKLFPNEEGPSKPEMILLKHSNILKDIHGPKYVNEPLFGDISNQVSNKRLKTIAKRATINKNLTTHVGRHTFATYMADKIPLHYLQAMMQHGKIATTMRYVQLNEKVVSDGLDKIQW